MQSTQTTKYGNNNDKARHGHKEYERTEQRTRRATKKNEIIMIGNEIYDAYALAWHIFFSLSLPRVYVSALSAQILYITDWIYFKIFLSFFVFGRVFSWTVSVWVCLKPQMTLFLFLHVKKNKFMAEAQEFSLSLIFFFFLLSPVHSIETVYFMEEKCNIYYDEMLDW